MSKRPILDRHYPMPVRNPIKRLLMYIAVFTLPVGGFIYRLHPNEEPERALTYMLWFIRCFFWLAIIVNGLYFIGITRG